MIRRGISRADPKKSVTIGWVSEPGTAGANLDTGGAHV